MSQFVNSIYDDYISGDKQQMLIIDLGCIYTKVGYSQETEPREIIKTPDLFNFKNFYLDVAKNVVNEYKILQNSDKETKGESENSNNFNQVSTNTIYIH